MAKTVNLIRNTNAKLVSANIDTLGVTFAAQSPYRADGFLKVNVTVANANPTQKMFLEGADFTIYAIGGNVTKLSAYSLSMFKELEQVWLFSSTMVEIEETDNNAYLDYLKPSCVIYVPSDLISNYQTAYSNLSSKFAPINEDYTLTIVGSGTLTSEIITDQIMNDTYNAQDRGACTKLVISGFDNYMDTLWGYNFSRVLPSLNNDIWYNATEIDFTTRELEGVDELLESDITNLINGISSDKLSGVTQLKFSGFSDMSVALTYDYSDLPNLAYIWLDNVRYEYSSTYKKVEYLRTSGTQYITTDYYPNNKTKIEFSWSNAVINGWKNLIGSSSKFRINLNNDNYAYIYYNDNYTVISGNWENGDITYKSEDGKQYLNSVNVFNDSAVFVDTTPLSILGTGGLQTDFATLKIYTDNVLVKELVPVKKNEEYLMLDILSGTEYPNNGTGNLTGGNIISNAILFKPTYFYPLSTLETEYDARLNQTFYLDYNGTLPSYPNYQLTYYTDINCTTSILPENMQSGTRYYVKAVMVTLVIQGSGTLTSAIVTREIAKASSNPSVVTKVVVPAGFTSIDSNALNALNNLPNIESLETHQNISFNDAYSNSQDQSTAKIKYLECYGNSNVILGYAWGNVQLHVYGLEKAIMHSGVVTSPRYAHNLKELILLEGASIGLLQENQSFNGLYALEYLELPTTITTLYANPFAGNASNPIGKDSPNGLTIMNYSTTYLAWNGDTASQNINPNKIIVRSNLLTQYMVGTNWSRYSQYLVGFFTYDGTLPTFTGYTPTFYEDEDCTIAITQADMVVDTQYYVKLTAI